MRSNHVKPGQSIPPAVLVGRRSAGKNKGRAPAETIGLKELAQDIAATGVLPGIGTAGSGLLALPFFDTDTPPTVLTSGVVGTLGSLTLGAGVWDVQGMAVFNPAALSFTITQVTLGLSTTAGVLPLLPNKGGFTEFGGIGATTFTLQTGVWHVHLPAGGTVYLVALATYH